MQRMIAGLRVHFSMRDVLASAQQNVEQRDTPIGRLGGHARSRATPRQSRGQGARQHASAGAHASRHRREVAVRGWLLCHRHRRAGTGGSRAAAALPGRAHHPARLHLPPALGAGHADAVGQPRCACTRRSTTTTVIAARCIAPRSRASARGKAFGRRGYTTQTEKPSRVSGNVRTRCPVAAKIALQIAGATGGNAGSPTPVGGLSLWMKCTSTFGCLRHAQDGVLVEVGLLDAAVLDGDLQAQHGAEAVDDRALALILRAAHVDDRADVAGDHHAMQAMRLFCIDADFGHFGEMAGVAE